MRGDTFSFWATILGGLGAGELFQERLWSIVMFRTKQTMQIPQNIRIHIPSNLQKDFFGDGDSIHRIINIWVWNQQRQKLNHHSPPAHGRKQSLEIAIPTTAMSSWPCQVGFQATLRWRMNITVFFKMSIMGRMMALCWGTPAIYAYILYIVIIYCAYKYIYLFVNINHISSDSFLGVRTCGQGIKH